MYRIGVDVGGTNTDAVVMSEREVSGWTKCPTTPDVTSGIVAALSGVLAKTRINRAAVEAAMIGTTHFTNAVIQRRGLTPVAVFRLCEPATHSLPPMIDWPSDLHRAVQGYTALLPGGFEFDHSFGRTGLAQGLSRGAGAWPTDNRREQCVRASQRGARDPSGRDHP
jgi:N-methylhydantoinase A/oxoprolinase/acetone carboxylase beta subunit